ncbi:ethanolamine utilization protein EutP [Clostridium collagenovorans DSM 3089]|uniref:Ethanolamine utilization protein EutP n=1 Tax=Clostridium collagenovorans DSM 3089 TaxID=1121306 RepID=A0A1M5TCR5_9CLOT|nr:EutP/PduV family microcompartment system protein [Clostridium collagenovorans]SHH48143.1 ethanolamine utilization protein EutP [Clostridium collagenovorans DSM 3089]
MKKVMFIGRTGTGKTTLTQALNNEKIEYKKTQSLEFSDFIIDTPGEYIENKAYYNALIVTSADADIIALLQDATTEQSIFPPGFGSIFAKPVIGIVTKVNKVSDENELEKSKEFLKTATCEKIFLVDSLENKGIEELREFLK